MHNTNEILLQKSDIILDIILYYLAPLLCRKSVLLVSKVNIPTNLCFLSISCIYPAWREISPQNMQNLSENTFQKFTW